MSVALDTALYLREQQLHNPLTLSERGVLFTLMFRVGSNPFTWISQESLSIELDIDMSNVKRNMRKLVAKGFIEVTKDTKDKRKNLYRPAEFLINYHQNNNREQTKKYGAIMHPNIENRVQNRPLNRVQNRPLLNSSIASQHIDNEVKKEDVSLPKAKEERNNKRKIKKKPVDDFVFPAWLKKELWDQFKEYRCEMKKPLTFIGEKRAIAKLESLMKEGYDPNYLVEEAIIRGWRGIYKVDDLKNSYVIESKREITPTRSTYVPYEEAVERDRREWEKMKIQSRICHV